MAAVAASAAGITAVDAEASPERQRRRVEVTNPGDTKEDRHAAGVSRPESNTAQ
jgi:hypothetical protein